MKKKILTITMCILLIIMATGAAQAAALAPENTPTVSSSYSDYDNSSYYNSDVTDDTENSSVSSAADSRSTVTNAEDLYSSLKSEFLISRLIIIIPTVILIIVFLILMRKFSRKVRSRMSFGALSLIRELARSESNTQSTNTRKSEFSTNAVPMDYTGKIIPTVRRVDYDFMAESFLTWANSVFITLQGALTARDWKRIVHLEKAELFEQHKRLIEGYIKNRQINVISNIRIDRSYLHKYERNPQYEYLTVYMATRMNHYIIDESTRRVVNGNPNVECNNNYLLTFMRKTGVRTHKSTGESVSKNCPNCGAPLRITNSGKCDYCNCIITTGDFDWVLAAIDAVTATTVIDNRGVIIND